MNDTSRASFDPEATQEVAPPPVGPGNRLAKARAAANLTKEQVAAHLNLTVTMVDAIERDATGELPAAVFVRGYIKNYARMVGLNGDDLVAMFESIRLPDAPLELRPRPAPDTGQGPRGPSARALGVTLLVVGVALAAWWWSEGGRVELGELARGFGGTPAPAPATLPTLAAPQPVAPQAVVPQPVQPPEPEAPAPAAAPAAAEAADPQPAEPVTAAPPAPPPEPPPPPQPTGHDLKLTLTGDVWVEVADVDGSKLVFDMLRAGTTREVNGEGPFLILLGKASAVMVELDGRAVDHAPFERKGIARFVLDDEGGEVVTRTP